MEEVIKKIIYIESKAQKVVNSAEQEKADKYEDLKTRLEELEVKLNQDAKKKIDRIREMELADAKEEASAKYEGCSGRIKMIEQYYKDNREKWCSDLFKQVIER